LRDYGRAEQLFRECIALASAEGDELLRCDALQMLGALALFQGRYEEGISCHQQGLEIGRKIGMLRSVAFDLVNLGMANWLAGRLDDAAAPMSEGVALMEELQEPGPHIYGLSCQALADVHAGRWDEAAARVQLALPMAENQSDFYVSGRLKRILGWISLVRGPTTDAVVFLERSIADFRKIHEHENIAWSLGPLAIATLVAGDPARSRQHLHEALEIVVDTGAFIPTQLILPAAALWLAANGLEERAIEVFALTAAHPFVAKSQLIAEVVGRRVSELTATLPVQTVTEIEARGRAQDRWQVLAQLLDEFSG
jgi:tetratricopeptide (TPR) repeat protein